MADFLDGLDRAVHAARDARAAAPCREDPWPEAEPVKGTEPDLTKGDLVLDTAGTARPRTCAICGKGIPRVCATWWPDPGISAVHYYYHPACAGIGDQS